MQVAILDDSGRVLNAQVEVEGNIITFHSRSGGGDQARNPDYRPALELILTRLSTARADPAIYLDSMPVQHIPLEQRRLDKMKLAGSPAQRFNILLRAMNADSSSNGAYRRLRLEVPGLAGPKLVRTISGNPSPSLPYERLPHEFLRRVTPAHVHVAVERFLSGDPHNFADSREFDLIVPGGGRLPPKAVFALALEQALGSKIYPVHFTGGLATPCFNILEQAGYLIVRKDDAAVGMGETEAGKAPAPGQHRPHAPTTDQVDEALNGMPVTSEERSWIEGNLKMASHMRRERAPGLAKAKRAAFVAEHGKLFCERCKMDPLALYGGSGEACIEVHHAKMQVAGMEEGHETNLNDLECLCANCHRVLHRELALAAI